MSGSDWKRLLIQQRAHKTAQCTPYSDASGDDVLVNSFLSGSRRVSRYSDVNYSCLLANLKGSQMAGEHQLQRVKRLAHRVKGSKEQTLLKQHREVWRTEQTRLEMTLKQTQREIDQWRAQVMLNKELGLDSFLAEVMNEEVMLSLKRRKFEEELIVAVQSAKAVKRCTRATLNDDEVKKQIKDTIAEQLRIREQLKEEYELCSTATNKLCKNEEEESLYTVKGIPNQLSVIDYPSDEFRQQMVKEINIIDEHFILQLEKLETLKSALSTIQEYWSEEKDFHFKAIMDQYNTVPLHQRRTLYVDRMTRELPENTRDQLVHHEACVRALRQYGKKKKALLAQWRQTKSGAAVQVMRLTEEAWNEWERRKMAKKEREEQVKLCHQLSNKVSLWHQQKIREQKVIDEQEALKLAQQEEALLLEERKKFEQRQEVKKQLMDYRHEKESQIKAELTLHDLQMKERKALMEEAAKKNKARVQYRESQWAIKQEQIARTTLEREELERDKEQRLERLRTQVRVKASSDPLRTMRHTEASRARLAANQDNNQEQELQQPLFPLHSYPADKVTSDPRFKVAAALREAGLLTSDYARLILSHVAPIAPPRRDMDSSLFK